MLRTRAALSQQIDCAIAPRRSALFPPTWSVMLSTPISQTQPGRSSFMREKLGGILRCATVSTVSDYTHSWLQREMRSRSVTVVVCILCLRWRSWLRRQGSAYRRGGPASPARGNGAVLRTLVVLQALATAPLKNKIEKHINPIF